MIGLATTALRSAFAFMPERSHRFFTLRLSLRSDIPLSDPIIEQHEKELRRAEERGEVLYAVRGKEGSWFEYVFQSPNELEPYNFLKQGVLNSHGLVESYSILELEMQLRVKDKELAPNYLRE